MNCSAIVQFRGIDASEALHARIQEHARRLSQFAQDVRSCRVVVSAERAPHHAGDRYRIDVHLVVGGREIHVGDSHASDPRHQNPYVAVADAFNVARRCLEDVVRRRRKTTTRPRPAAAKSA